MLITMFLALLVLWLLGMISSVTLGGFIHLLLVLALALVVICLFQERSPVSRGSVPRTPSPGSPTDGLFRAPGQPQRMPGR